MSETKTIQWTLLGDRVEIGEIAGKMSMDLAMRTGAGGCATLADAGRQRAASTLAAEVAKRFHSTDAYRTYMAERKRLEDAQKEIAGLERQQTRAALDREELLASATTGTTLTNKLGKLEQAQTDAEAKIAESGRGLEILARRVASAHAEATAELRRCCTAAAGELGKTLASEIRTLRHTIAGKLADDLTSLATLSLARSRLSMDAVVRQAGAGLLADMPAVGAPAEAVVLV